MFKSSNKTGYTLITFYVALLLIYMLFLPFGDEPDFIRVVPKYIDFLSAIHLNYFDENFEIIANLDPRGDFGYKTFAVSNCQRLVSTYTLLGVYDYDSCVQEKILVFKRTLLTLFIYLPFLIFILKDAKTLAIKNKPLFKDFSISNESFQLCFLFPGFIYYHSVFSIEQITLMLSILVVFSALRTKYFFVLTIFFILYTLDEGNAIVVGVVILYIIGSIYLFKKTGLLSFLIVNFIFMILVYIINVNILYFIEPLNSHITSIINDASHFQNSPIAEDLRNKYPLWSRPLLTYLSYNFMPPALSKHIILYLVVLSGFFYTIYRQLFSKNPHKPDFIYIVSIIATFSIISMIVFILPTHNNAKYYIFTLPFLMNILLYYYSYETLFKFLLALNLIVLMGYSVFYSIGCEGKGCSTFFGLAY